LKYSFDNEVLKPPTNFDNIYGRLDEKLWLKAVEDELTNMKSQKVYKYISCISKGKNVISCRWVFTYKKDDKGRIIKYKARLVARGFSQVLGIDYREIFPPTLKQDSLRVIIAVFIILIFTIILLIKIDLALWKFLDI